MPSVELQETRTVSAGRCLHCSLCAEKRFAQKPVSTNIYPHQRKTFSIINFSSNSIEVQQQQQQQRNREQPDEDQSDDGGDTNSSAGTEVGDIGGAIISSSSSNSNSNDGSGGEKIQMDLSTSDELSDDVFYESDIIEPDEE